MALEGWQRLPEVVRRQRRGGLGVEAGHGGLQQEQAQVDGQPPDLIEAAGQQFAPQDDPQVAHARLVQRGQRRARRQTGADAGGDRLRLGGMERPHEVAQGGPVRLGVGGRHGAPGQLIEAGAGGGDCSLRGARDREVLEQVGLELLPGGRRDRRAGQQDDLGGVEAGAGHAAGQRQHGGGLRRDGLAILEALVQAAAVAAHHDADPPARQIDRVEGVLPAEPGLGSGAQQPVDRAAGIFLEEDAVAVAGHQVVRALRASGHRLVPGPLSGRRPAGGDVRRLQPGDDVWLDRAKGKAPAAGPAATAAPPCILECLDLHVGTVADPGQRSFFEWAGRAGV